MKTYVLKLALLFFGLSLIFSCEPEISYQLHVEELTNKNETVSANAKITLINILTPPKIGVGFRCVFLVFG
jgi:hypothetical protein